MKFVPVINELVKTIHDHNVEAGWYTDLSYQKKIQELKFMDFTDAQIKNIIDATGISEIKGNIPEKMALIHSEVSEALEGLRKNLMDDKIPHRKMVEVELADVVIRCMDLAGFMKLDLGGAMVEKLAYNFNRPDHKIENRLKDNGKAF